MKTWTVIAGALVVELAMAIALVPWTDHKHIETTDFVNFYTAATIVRQGNGRVLYRTETQDPILQSIVGRHVTEYFLHPPFEAAVLAPLSYLTIDHAFVVWALFNVSLLGLLPLLLMQCISNVEKRPYLGLLGFVFPPALIALTLGQDSIIILLVITSAYWLLSKRRYLLAGLVLSLGTIKFQYVLIVVLLLAFRRKFRLVAGFALGCIFLLTMSAIVVGPAGLFEYARFVHDFNSHSGYGNLRVDLMVNARGFFSGIGLAQIPLASAMVSVALVAAGIVCSRWTGTSAKNSLLFAISIAIALAASPYAFFEDAVILLLPIFLAMDWVSARHSNRIDLVSFCCVALFLWPVVLMIAGGHYWWNSRIYLMFPLIVLFIGSLATEIYRHRLSNSESLST